MLQVFVDDFQSPAHGSRFQVRMDGVRVPDLESMINRLRQSGPIGKLLSFELPPEIFPLLRDGELVLSIDDPETGAADGFAIDFAQLLVNPRNWPYSWSKRLNGNGPDSPETMKLAQ